MLKTKDFATKEELVKWVNENEELPNQIVKDVTDGRWHLFYY